MTRHKRVAWGTFAFAALLAPSIAVAANVVRDLPIAKSQTTPPAVMKVGTTYEASTMKPTPVFKPAVGGWRGVQARL